jgi:hypothetical protein
MASRATARSEAISCNVELTKTRTRWSGVRIIVEPVAIAFTFAGLPLEENDYSRH